MQEEIFTMAIEESYNFRRINSALTTSGVVGPDRLRELSSEGYALVINLLPDSSEYAVAEERGIVQSQDIEYIYIPVDFLKPERSDFEHFVRAMDGATDRKVHVHCAANYRASAFYALYAIKRGIWCEQEALEFIGDIWAPNDHVVWAEFISEIKET